MSYRSRNELMQELKKNGRKLGEQAAQNVKALKVIKYYDMWRNKPDDNMAFTFCERAYKEWEDEINESNKAV